MPVYKTIQEYLSVVEDQIRWKRARPVISLELRRHLEDQRDAFAAEGFPNAEQMAVEEMGDPAETGIELDRIHRPKPQWGLLGMAVILAAAGGFLRVWLTAGAAYETGRTVMAIILGTAALLGGYFLDCSRLLCRPKTVYIAALCVSILFCLLSPSYNNRSYYMAYIVQIYPVIYAIWLYEWRGKGWKGFLTALAGGIPMIFCCMAVPALSGALILMCSGLVLLLYAVGAGWFQVSKPLAAAFLTGLALAFPSLVFLKYGQSLRLKTLFHPELDPFGSGYQAVTVRNALSASQWLGEGSADFAPMPFEQYVPEWNRDFLLTTVVYRLGWLPFLLVVLAMAALLVWMLAKWSRNKAGQMLVLSVILVFICRIMFSVAMNIGGFVLFSSGFPMLVGNLQSIVDMGMIGLALSVFREGSILQESRNIVTAVDKE